ncbi:MAG: transposase [Ignavibacteriaceae bacterium]|jgi:hypothetical protein|nr:transposase [Ignavibacteriaceae bacterium]
MLVFYLKNHRVIKQYQLLDWIDEPKIINQTYKKYNITRPLEYLERKLLQWSMRIDNRQIPALNYTLYNYINPYYPRYTIISEIHTSIQGNTIIESENSQIFHFPLESFIIDSEIENNITPLLATAVKAQYFLRFPFVPPVTYENHCQEKISKDHWIYYQELPEFKGYFIDLFLLHPLTECIDYEIELRRKGWHPKGFSIQQIMYWEMFRIHFGIQNYSQLYRIYGPIIQKRIYPNHPLMKTIPDEKAMSYGLNSIDPLFIKSLFLKLVKDSLKYKIIIPRIGSGDGVFIRSNCSNNRNHLTGEYNDATAGFRMHIGKRQGVGFTIIVILCYCKDRWLPVYYKSFSGNSNENPAFRETMSELNEIFPNFFNAITYDSGASSNETNQLIRSFDAIPLIRAKKNYLADTIFELRDGYYFWLSDIPDDWSLGLMDAVYSTRAMIEQFFAAITTVHHIKRMNMRGKDNVDRLLGIYLTTVVIQALTSFKLNRPDLMMCPTAFTDIEWLNY